MPGAADFVTAVLALPNLDCLIECQDASGNPVDSSPNGFDMTSISGTVTYQVAGPDGGTDFGISLNPGVMQRSSPMNTNTSDWAVGMWVRWIGNSVNQALVENGNPGANGYGALLVASAAIRAIAHGVGFLGTTTENLDDGLWQFFGFQRTAGGAWEAYFNGAPDASNPLSTSGMGTPTTKFIITRDGAQAEVAYVFSVSQALSAATWEDLYGEMVGSTPDISGAAVVGQTLTSSAASAYQWESSPDGISSWTPIGGETASTYVVDVGELGNWLRVVVDYGGPDFPSDAIGPVIPIGTGPVVVGAFSGDHSNGYSPTTYTPDTSGVLAGDYMIVTIEAAFTGGTGEITPPAGWEVLEYDTVLGVAKAAVYAKLTYEDTPTETWTFPSAASFVGTLTAVRGGFDPSLPIVDYGKTTDNSLTDVDYENADLVLGITLGNDAFSPAAINSVPSGFTDVIEEAVSAVVVTGWMTDSTKLEALASGDTSGLTFIYQTGTDLFTVTILIPFNPGDVPEIVTAPVASGDVIVAGTVETTDGTWTFSPTGFSYQWQHSADGISGWANIGGETASTYEIDIAYDGEFLRCVVTASNAEGAGVPEPSNVLGPVLPYPTVRYFTAIA